MKFTMSFEMDLEIEVTYAERGSRGGEYEPPSGNYYEYIIYFVFGEKRIPAPAELYDLYHDKIYKEIGEYLD